jgi:hypothetical protein
VNYSREAQHLANEISIGIANWATGVAIADIKWLLGTFGNSTEPDLIVILPVYDRMLAISLLLLGAVVAFALIERIAWGSLGTGLALIPRVVAACFAAYAGLGVVKYAAGYAALLATAWSGDFASLSNLLSRNVATSNAVMHASASGPHVSTFGLIVTALCLSSLAVMVHLELIIRSALILTVTAFVPLVCVFSIWPRLASAATTLCEFLIGLLLSKFVVATVVYVGFRLVVVALTSPTSTQTTENWMASGVAVLLIAAFSPLIIFSALRFAHTQAGSVARSWSGAAVSMAPTGKLLGNASRVLGPVARSAQLRLGPHAKSVIGRIRSRL